MRDDPASVFLKRIGRWYNVRFNILDERAMDFTCWATFEEENLDQLLKLISLTGQIKFKKIPRQKLEDGSYTIQEINVTIDK